MEAAASPAVPPALASARAASLLRRAVALQLLGRAAEAEAALGPWRELAAKDAALRPAAEEELSRLVGAGVAAERLEPLRAALGP